MQLKVYVGGISWNIDDQGLLDAFSQFGQCEATIMKDKYTGRSRGFGFVTYQSAEECTRAIEEMNGKCRVFCPAPGRVGNLEALCSGPAHDHGISCMCSALSCIHAYTLVCIRSNAMQARSWMVGPLHATTLARRRTTKLRRREQGKEAAVVMALAVAARKWLAMSKTCDYAAATLRDGRHSVWRQQGQFGLTSVVSCPWYSQNGARCVVILFHSRDCLCVC